MKDLNLSRDELDALIDQWILGKNAERNRRLLKRRLFDGICYEPLAEEFEISDKQARNIVNKCMAILIKHI